jgi:hypothetical protein
MNWRSFNWRRAASRFAAHSWLFVAGLCVFCIGVLSLVPGAFRPHTVFSGQEEHFLAYFLTAFILGNRPWDRLSQRASLAAALCMYAGVLEMLQLWIPARSAQAIDFAASSCGACIGAVAAAAFFGVQRIRRIGGSRWHTLLRWP